MVCNMPRNSFQGFRQARKWERTPKMQLHQSTGFDKNFKHALPSTERAYKIRWNVLDDKMGATDGKSPIFEKAEEHTNPWSSRAASHMVHQINARHTSRNDLFRLWAGSRGQLGEDWNDHPRHMHACGAL